MKYNLTIPATLSILMTIEADSPEEAIEKMWDVPFGVKIEPMDPKDEAYLAAAPEVHEFEIHEHVTQGNVCHAVLNSIEVEEADY